MLSNQLIQFIEANCERNTENVIFNIFACNLDTILQSEEKHIASKTIESKLTPLFAGEALIKYIPKCEPNQIISNEIYDKRIYISKVKISGIKGFRCIKDSCKEKDKKACTDLPILTLDCAKSAVVFGWNGEGKSSLTEGIEFCLTGDVIEKTRRGKKLNEYLLNSSSENGQVAIELFEPYSPPRTVTLIRNVSKKNVEVKVESESKNELFDLFDKNLSKLEDYLGKHFIERNRIENFILSRGVENRKAYGELLGLEELYSFIKNSLRKTDSEAKQDIFSTQSTNRNLLKSKLDEISKLESQSVVEPILEITPEDKKLIDSLGVYNDNKKTFHLQVTEKVLEEIATQGKLDNDINQLDEITKRAVEYSRLSNYKEGITRGIANCMDSIELYKLYEIASKVIKESDIECPLCGNKNLIGVKLIEYINNKKLEYKETNELIHELNQTELSIKDLYIWLLDASSKIFSDGIIQLTTQDILDGTLVNKCTIKKVVLQSNKKQYVDKLVELNKKISKYAKEYIEYCNQLEYNHRRIEQLRKEISENKLEEKVVLEEKVNQLKEKVLTDYKSFEEQIGAYYLNLLNSELCDISSYILDYYNEFEPEQKINKIKTDSSDGIQFLVSFSDDIFLDPLTVLSEGQLRCFGLAILLSISKKIKANFLIMDDIVNAIDVEHRSNIIKVLCNEMEDVNRRQLIITTHDKLFREKLVNSINNKNKIKTYSFSCSGVISEDTNNIIFENNISRSISNRDCRTALIYMRILIENTIYSMAHEQVEILFKDQIYKYKLESVFESVAKKDPRVMNIYQYFIANDRLHWGIINQENHFWSEQSICLDCNLIKEIYDNVLRLNYISIFNKLSSEEKDELIRQKDYTNPDVTRFRENSRVIGLFIDSTAWNEKFNILKKAFA